MRCVVVMISLQVAMGACHKSRGFTNLPEADEVLQARDPPAATQLPADVVATRAAPVRRVTGRAVRQLEPLIVRLQGTQAGGLGHQPAHEGGEALAAPPAASPRTWAARLKPKVL